MKRNDTPERAKSEFSRPFNVERLQDSPRLEKIVANESERAALAKRLEIPAIHEFKAELELSRLVSDDKVIELRGTLTAKVVQECIVTLEPVEQSVEESFDTLLADEGYVARWLRDHPHDELEGPEPLAGSWLDLGELAAQYLSLALNPYPRKEGVPLPDYIIGSVDVAGSDDETEATQTPFAVLKTLKDRFS